MFKKIVVNCSSQNTAFSSGYTVPPGKVFLLTGVMLKTGTDSDLYQRARNYKSIVIFNQEGSGFIY